MTHTAGLLRYHSDKSINSYFGASLMKFASHAASAMIIPPECSSQAVERGASVPLERDSEV